MPNWCNNTVSVAHQDPEKLRALVAAINEGKFCDHVIPVPDDLKITAGFVGDPDEQKKLEEATARNVAKYGAGNWYDFCTSRWGTKWDVDPYETVEFDPLGVTFGFDSAWSPPMGIYEVLVEQGFSVTAYYYEPGMAYVGKYEDGVDECFDYGGETSKTVVDCIGEELDEMFGISESMAEYEEENMDELEEFLVEGAEAKGLTKPDPIKFD